MTVVYILSQSRQRLKRAPWYYILFGLPREFGTWFGRLSGCITLGGWRFFFCDNPLPCFELSSGLFVIVVWNIIASLLLRRSYWAYQLDWTAW